MRDGEIEFSSFDAGKLFKEVPVDSNTFETTFSPESSIDTSLSRFLVHFYALKVRFHGHLMKSSLWFP